MTTYVYDNDPDVPLARLTFLGETSRKNVSKQTIVDYVGTDSAHTYACTYQNKYDGQGRMSQQLEFIEDAKLNGGKARVSQLKRYYY